MRQPENVPVFSKALLSGALTGIIATIANMVYDIIFRSITRFMPAEEFNFFSITFASMLVLLFLGLIFFLFMRYINLTSYVITIFILVIACILITAFFHATPNEKAFYGDHGLIAGFTLISGILAITVLPYFYKHPKIYI